MFDTPRGNRIKDLFSEAIDLDQSEREAFLDRITQGDATLRVAVDALVRAHERAGDFLADPTTPGLDRHGEVIGRYTLVRLIGEGGFGHVYLAEQREPVRRRVALKIIKLGMDTREVIARFEAERQALAIMDHPGIATVFDAGATATGRPYFVMELVEGVPITDYCNQNRLSIDERIHLFAQTCAAVQHAHTKGVIHRDLKPGNVLVSERDGMPLPKIIDFGIAKATSAKLTDDSFVTERRSIMGTPQYMSPEQFKSNAADIDTRADVYSLGVVLYELLTGVTPVDGGRLRSADIVDVPRIIRDEEPPKPSTRLSFLSGKSEIAAQRSTDTRRLTSRVRGDLDWITLKALEKDRERRYHSAAEFADDLRRHLRHEPVLAGRPTAMYKFRKFARRHWIGVLATCLVALAVLGGAAGLAVGMVQARDSAEQARDAAEQAQAVNDFMQEILTSVKPEQDGADVRLVEVMDDASAVASRRFDGHPLLEARIRDLLGHVYDDLSMYAKAKTEFRRAMDLWQQHAGPDDPRAIMSDRFYVGSAINNQQIEEVESRLPLLAERTRRVFGPNDVATLDVRRSIGISHMLHGRTDEAERIFLEVRARLMAHGDDDGLQIRTLRNLIRVGRMRSFGAESSVRAAIVAQIEPLAREQVERAVRAFGASSLIALNARIMWAENLADQRQYDAAVQACRDALDSASDRLGECHHLRVQAFDVLAEASHRAGDSATAADLKLRKINCMRQRESAMSLIVAISDSLPILDRGERWVEGEALAREFVEKLAAMGGGHGDMVFDVEVWRTRFISLQGRLDEAEALFQALLIRAEEADLTSNVRARIHLFHGSNLRRQGALEEAEAEIQTAADTVSDFRRGTRNTNPDDILIEFITLYNAWGKPERAAEFEAIREHTLANLPIDPS